MTRGEKLVDEILTGSSRDVGVAANQLLAEFSRGLSLGHLRCLLTSERSEVVRSGVWIASELGRSSQPVIEEVGRLLNHGEEYVRFFAIDSLLTTTGREHGELVARVIGLMDDQSAAVRQKVLDFLARASASQLESAADWLEHNEPSKMELVPKLRRLLNHGAIDGTRLAEALQSESAIDRKLGAVAAIRYGALDTEILASAANAPDPEIRGIAKSAQATRQRRQEHDARFKSKGRTPRRGS